MTNNKMPSRNHNYIWRHHGMQWSATVYQWWLSRRRHCSHRSRLAVWGNNPGGVFSGHLPIWKTMSTLNFHCEDIQQKSPANIANEPDAKGTPKWRQESAKDRQVKPKLLLVGHRHARQHPQHVPNHQHPSPPGHLPRWPVRPPHLLLLKGPPAIFSVGLLYILRNPPQISDPPQSKISTR